MVIKTKLVSSELLGINVLRSRESKAAMVIEISGQPVGRIGYGLMGLTWRARPTPQAQAFEAMRAALKTGANFWNGAEFYGSPHRNSLHLLSEYFSQYPEDAQKVVLSIKDGMSPAKAHPDDSEDNIRRSVDECLRILNGKKSIDVFGYGVCDPRTPIEETMKTLADLVREGKIGGIGLSGVGAGLIRRAHRVHPIAVVEVELNLWATDNLKNGVATVCAELGIPMVACSPLMRGALTGHIGAATDIPEDDLKMVLPRLRDDVLAGNMRVAREVGRLAEKKRVTKAQFAIGWVRALSGRNGMPTIIPIPGATTSDMVLENGEEVDMAEDEMKEVEKILMEYEVLRTI